MNLRSLGRMLILLLAPGLVVAAEAPSKAPFELTAAEQSALDALLKAWEANREHGFVFHHKFNQYQYDRTFGPRTTNDLNELESFGEGEIDYKSPQEWRLQETTRREYSFSKEGTSPSKLSREGLLRLYKSSNYLSTFSRAGEHFVIGFSISCRFKADESVNKWPRNRILPQLIEGPLPVAFSEHPAQLAERYWLRLTTPEKEQGKNIWLDAVPKLEQSNCFDRVELILSSADYDLVAVQVVLPGGTVKKSFIFLPDTNDAQPR